MSVNVENSSETKLKEVRDWLDNLVASYENYLEFTKFPGGCNAHTFESELRHPAINLIGLVGLCTYANIPYNKRVVLGGINICNFEYKGISFFDYV